MTAVRRQAIELRDDQMQDKILPPGSFAGAPIPWWGKIAAKLVLSRMPVPHSMWSKLNIFRHSYSSDDPEEQVSGVRTRLDKFVRRFGRIPRTVLELGPGEITTSAVVYKALGVDRIIFVDVGDFGVPDPESRHSCRRRSGPSRVVATRLVERTGSR